MFQIRGAAFGAYYLESDVLLNSALLADTFTRLPYALHGAAQRER
jgi:hypothetical protein